MTDRKDSTRLPRLNTGPMRVVGRSGDGKEKEGWNARQWLKDMASRSGRYGGGNKNRAGMNTITVQALICTFIITAVLVLKAINMPNTVEVLAGLDTALTTTADIDKALGKLKFVGDFFSESAPVFSPETQGFVPPIKDMVIETGGSPQYVISIDIADALTPVLAAADGQVFYAGSNNVYGTLMIIRHQEGYETWYGGITSEVKTGSTVLAGERVGTIRNGTLKFLAYRDNVALDPRPYLKKPGG